MQLRIRGILSTLAVVKDVAEVEILFATSSSLPDPRAPIPKQIRYIIGNEGCERFSFYGMRNILTVFLVSSLLLYLPEGDRARSAKDVFHTFVIGVYFFPFIRRLASRPFLRQIPYRLLAKSGLLRGSGVSGYVCHEPHRFLHRTRTDRARLGRD